MLEVSLHPRELGRGRFPEPVESPARESGNRRRVAYLRELRGGDELALADLDPAPLDHLLSDLLVDMPDAAIAPGQLGAASVGDRDLLVAALYCQCFGEMVESQVACTACAGSFETCFSLSEEIASATREAQKTAQREPADGPDSEGFYQLASGLSFRLPTVADERELRGTTPECRRRALLARCARNPVDAEAGEPLWDELTIAAVERAMAARDPAAGLTVSVPCASCRSPQSIAVDIVELFLATVIREKPLLAREIHSLAITYHWSFQEIANLPRRQRHAQVELIELMRDAMGGALT